MAGRAAGDGQLLHPLGVTVVRRVNAELPRLDTLDTADRLRVLAAVCRPADKHPARSFLPITVALHE